MGKIGFENCSNMFIINDNHLVVHWHPPPLPKKEDGQLLVLRVASKYKRPGRLIYKRILEEKSGQVYSNISRKTNTDTLSKNILIGLSINSVQNLRV